MPNHNTDNHLVDLEIRIFPRQEGQYPVEFTLAGQQEFPRGYMEATILPWVSTKDLVADGQRLLAALLADPALQKAWSEIKGQAPTRRIRLRLDYTAAELNAIPWELLYEDMAMLSANANTPFSRYLPIALPWGGAVEERPIRMLVLISNPDDLEASYNLAQLNVELERETLNGVLETIEAQELEVTFLDPPVTLARVEEALRQGYHILHYLGHGAFNARRQKSALFMQDEAGHTHLVRDDALVQMLARQDIHPRLVFLAACQSASPTTGEAFQGMAPKMVSVGVPAVVAMQDFVAVKTARQFSTAFYQQLLAHGRVDKAVNEARSTLLSAERADAVVPVLFMRLKSGQLWGEEANARGHVLGDEKPDIFWKGLIRKIQRGKCIPVIGPRVHGRWLPTPEEIAHHWAEMYKYPLEDRDNLAGVAQYMASSQGEDFPRDELLYKLMQTLTSRIPEELKPQSKHNTLTDIIQAISWTNLSADDPNEVHRVLASLDLPLYLTTNFDSFMFEALVAESKEAAREICRWNLDLDGLPSLFEDDPNYEPTAQSPLIYHLFGSDEEFDSLVLTNDHYLDFLVQISAEMERVPNYVRGALANSSLMFVGYSLSDWEFRVIMRGLVATASQRRRFKHVAVQLEVGDTDTHQEDVVAVQQYLESYFQDAQIDVFWGSTQQFIAELREWWESERR